MTKEELLTRVLAIDQEAKKRREELYRAYAYANNTVKNGDIISDRETCICVKKWVYMLIFMVPRKCAISARNLQKRERRERTGGNRGFIKKTSKQ